MPITQDRMMHVVAVASKFADAYQQSEQALNQDYEYEQTVINDILRHNEGSAHYKEMQQLAEVAQRSANTIRQIHFDFARNNNLIAMCSLVAVELNHFKRAFKTNKQSANYRKVIRSQDDKTPRTNYDKPYEFPDQNARPINLAAQLDNDIEADAAHNRRLAELEKYRLHQVDRAEHLARAKIEDAKFIEDMKDKPRNDGPPPGEGKSIFDLTDQEKSALQQSGTDIDKIIAEAKASAVAVANAASSNQTLAHADGEVIAHADADAASDAVGPSTVQPQRLDDGTIAYLPTTEQLAEPPVKPGENLI